MKKSVLFLATAAIFAACTNDSVRENIAEDQVEIGFSTYIQKPVASKADNSNATEVNSLSNYHTTFVVNGYKNVAGNDVQVFADQLVTFADSKWGYSPVSYWDKSAAHYSFYAAAPQTTSWTFNNNTKGKYYSISGFTLIGNSLELTANDDFSASASFSGVDTDLMIATDIDNHTDFTETAVNFTFNHILSRLNISIAKASDLSAAKVTLQSLTINKMKNVGDFDESKVSGTDLSNGTVERWTASGSATISNASDATDLTVTEVKQWIYQGLVIPQTVEVEAINLDGTKSDGEVVAKPYLTINYSISTTSGTVTNTQEYSYNYNLADLFNGDGTGNIDFCEGWQNNLNITIGAGIPIKFDAKVYDWATKVDGSYQVKP